MSNSLSQATAANAASVEGEMVTAMGYQGGANS